MPHTDYHEDPQLITEKTKDLHRAIVSLQEELEAVDWYQQRADACQDQSLKNILLHNMNEEVEHAAMLTEWLRRNHAGFATELKTYLFSKGDLTKTEEA